MDNQNSTTGAYQHNTGTLTPTTFLFQDFKSLHSLCAFIVLITLCRSFKNFSYCANAPKVGFRETILDVELLDGDHFTSPTHIAHRSLITVLKP